MSPLVSTPGHAMRSLECTHRYLDDRERLCRGLLVKVPVPSDEFIVGKKGKPHAYCGFGSLAVLTVGPKVTLENTSSRMFVVLYG
jgi:hypothetical protein